MCHIFFINMKFRYVPNVSACNPNTHYICTLYVHGMHLYINISLYLRIYIHYIYIDYSEWMKVALRPSNAKRLYMDEKSTEIGEIKE